MLAAPCPRALRYPHAEGRRDFPGKAAQSLPLISLGVCLQPPLLTPRDLRPLKYLAFLSNQTPFLLGHGHKGQFKKGKRQGVHCELPGSISPSGLSQAQPLPCCLQPGL